VLTLFLVRKVAVPGGLLISQKQTPAHPERKAGVASSKRVLGIGSPNDKRRLSLAGPQVIRGCEAECEPSGIARRRPGKQLGRLADYRHKPALAQRPL